MNGQVTFNELVKGLKNRSEGTYKPVKVAVLADFASQHLSRAIKAAGFREQLDLDIWEADYDSVYASVMNTSSPLYEGGFHYIFIAFSPLKAYRQFSSKGSKSDFAARTMLQVRQIVEQLKTTGARIILSNYAEFDDGVFGNFANKTAESFLFQMRRLNMELMELAAVEPILAIVDAQSQQLLAGREATFDPKLYVHADIVYNLDFLAQLALRTVRIVSATEGRFKKCVVLDLDNTIWGGIIGDDGPDRIEIGDLGIGKAFTALQYWLRNLKNRGIILAVCSKNTEHIAREPFEKHPGMILRPEDISVFVANWETKVDNITFIRSVLNIGFDSMVFLDDNPFERAIVRQHIPDITVPELPEDPALYLEYLQTLGLFETASFTADDAGRTRQYQEEAGRAVMQKSFASEAEFLQSLQMEARVKPVESYSVPRVAQLTQRSNQFNLRTVRYTEADIARIAADDRYRTLTISLQDTFGDYGLVSAIILQQQHPAVFFIDTWIMSCRVLKRGVEALVINEIVRLARAAGVTKIVGEYLPTPKNAIVKDHYEQLGFNSMSEGNWELDVATFSEKTCFISINKEQYAF